MQLVRKIQGILLAGTAALLSSHAAQAHHSKAMFDETKCLALEGTVRSLEWEYPHSWLWIVVLDPSTGAGDVWGFESMSPSQLQGVDKHWSRDVLKKGDKVKVNFSPLKDGRHGGSMSFVTLADGRVLLGAPDACQGLHPHNPGDAP